MLVSRIIIAFGVLTTGLCADEVPLYLAGVPQPVEVSFVVDSTQHQVHGHDFSSRVEGSLSVSITPQKKGQPQAAAFAGLPDTLLVNVEQWTGRCICGDEEIRYGSRPNDRADDRVLLTAYDRAALALCGTLLSFDLLQDPLDVRLTLGPTREMEQLYEEYPALQLLMPMATLEALMQQLFMPALPRDRPQWQRLAPAVTTLVEIDWSAGDEELIASVSADLKAASPLKGSLSGEGCWSVKNGLQCESRQKVHYVVALGPGNSQEVTVDAEWVLVGKG